MRQMRRTTAVSALLLGMHWIPAAAQTVIFTEPQVQNQVPVYPGEQQPRYGTQPVYVDPQSPYVTQPQRQPQYLEPVPQQPQPQPQPGYGQPLPQPQPGYDPSPSPQWQTNPAPTTPGQTTETYSNPFGGTVPATAPEGTRRGDRAPGMASELDELVRVGERYRAASPGFLEDLRALAEKYREPLPALAAADDNFDGEDTEDTFDDGATLALNEPPGSGDPALSDGTVATVEPLSSDSISTIVYLSDDFTDGDFSSNPAWSVRQGNWTVDPQYGLRAAQAQQAAGQPIRPQEILNVLLGGDAPSRSQSSEPKAALIEAPTSIPNAFSLAARITDHKGEGAAHFIMHQGGADWLGYRLEVRSGAQPAIVLTRRGASGYKDINKVQIPGFTPGKPHELRWARLSDGQMFVVLNGEPVITSRDTVFREDWSGFAFFNAGGDVSIRSIRVAMPIER